MWACNAMDKVCGLVCERTNGRPRCQQHEPHNSARYGCIIWCLVCVGAGMSGGCLGRLWRRVSSCSGSGRCTNLSNLPVLVCATAVFDRQGDSSALLLSLMWGLWMVQAPCSRDVLLLDIALDNYLRTLLERQDKGSLGGDDLCELIALSLRNAVIAIDSEDLRQVRHCLCFPLHFCCTPCNIWSCIRWCLLHWALPSACR